MKELVIGAKVENLDQVIGFIDEILEKNDCSIRVQTQIDVAVEEIFVNIAHYAYTPETGDARIVAEVEGDPLAITITFSDSGVHFDPLAKEDPDISLSAKERPIGGLGIFMVKKSMDEVSYEYKDGKNIFTIKKFL